MDDFQLRVLLCFLKRDGKDCSVTELARTLVVEKYAVSRAMSAMEKEGLINRTEPRRPYITEYGRKLALKYQKRIDTALSHLLYAGVSNEAAYKDAWLLARECSDETFYAVQEKEKRLRIKYELRNRMRFDGDILSGKLENGSIYCPFVIYRDTATDEFGISCVNDCFEHPCEIVAKNGKGVIRMKAKMYQKNVFIKDVDYYDGYRYIHAEKNGVFFQFPLEMIKFTNIGGVNSIVLHGSISIKVFSINEFSNITEHKSILTVII